MRAVKNNLPTPSEEVGKSEGPRTGTWHVSVCQWVGEKVAFFNTLLSSEFSACDNNAPHPPRAISTVIVARLLHLNRSLSLEREAQDGTSK